MHINCYTHTQSTILEHHSDENPTLFCKAVTNNLHTCLRDQFATIVLESTANANDFKLLFLHIIVLVTEELIKWAGPLIILIDIPFLKKMRLDLVSILLSYTCMKTIIKYNTKNTSSVKSKPMIIPVSVLQGHLLTGDKDQQL